MDDIETDQIQQDHESANTFQTDQDSAVQSENPDSSPELSEVQKTIETSLFELRQAALCLTDAKKSFERDAKLISESSDALVRYWKQSHWYYGLVGMIVTLILGGSAFGVFYLKSADRQLSKAHVSLSSVPGQKSIRLILTGDQILASGRSDHQVVVEFSK
jgi:hypothetical protein